MSCDAIDQLVADLVISKNTLSLSRVVNDALATNIDHRVHDVIC